MADRRRLGREARRALPRSVHGRWQPASDRPDPIALLRAGDAGRTPDLVPIRYGRMSASPFACFRGAAAVMAADLAATPHTPLATQLCGDAHLSNFGLFASPERTLLFDINDFDETLPGPFEWDVKRLAASLVIAARDAGWGAQDARDAVLAAVRSYRERMLAYAEMSELEVWYSRVAAEDLQGEIASLASGKVARSAERSERAVEARARTRDSLQAFDQLTRVVDGRREIVDDPPLIVHLPLEQQELRKGVHQAFVDYRKTLADDRRVLLERFTPVDIARQVVGVGSVGVVCLIVLLVGRSGEDPLFLQVKQAGPSVLEPYLGRSRHTNNGHRVVAGQRLMQAASDILLGWVRGTGAPRRDFYWRQLRDMKGSFESARTAAGLALYGASCGWALARAHARAGDPVVLATYLGRSDRFERALADFAETYADQAERDFEQLTAAIARGAVPAETGV
jgi:uncharacterized protein (DUF2252 family)